VVKDYLEAIGTSVKTAGHGIAFADDAVELCESLGLHPMADLLLFIDEMRQIAHRAHGDAKDTYEKFSVVQRTLLQVCIRDMMSAGAIC
jgi:hypothetical protein